MLTNAYPMLCLVLKLNGKYTELKRAGNPLPSRRSRSMSAVKLQGRFRNIKVVRTSSLHPFWPKAEPSHAVFTKWFARGQGCKSAWQGTCGTQQSGIAEQQSIGIPPVACPMSWRRDASWLFGW
eukprot:CAMPEP_0172709714 /NCGR_PEP_ID=MMETSP1074-20121228/55228_1 /TAXON_ID=2916 /ORGANISM="Ceratium fusus, Strain PA161109" /LENGTH=123 /DNA_ID=CAMNT_0013533013 /DNA_START=395 /DNA_END=766 /DNA_ORIENTATION=-